MDRETQRAIRKLAAQVARIDDQARRQGRAQRRPQLAHSSLEEGQVLEARGPGGRRQRWGWIDGAIGTVTEGGEPVSAPTEPTVTPSLGGLRVTWDGQLANDAARPVDLDHLDVHVSTEAGFTPSAATRVGSIRRGGGGGMLPVVPLPYTEHYVVLVPVTTGGIQGDPSPEVAATPVQVEGPDLTAGSVTAPIIAGGAVTADKLEAILVLASTIVGGIPGGARVELDQDGIRGYNTANELIFAIDSSGNAVFTGNVTGSTITGSVIEIGEKISGSNYGVLTEQADGSVMLSVQQVGGPRAQLMAEDGSAELSVWGSEAASSPVAGVTATPTSTQFVFFSDFSQAYNAPHSVVFAEAGGAGNQWVSPTGSRIRVVADADYAAFFSAPQDSETEPEVTVDGALYAFRGTVGDVPRVTLQSPVVGAGPGAHLRSLFFLDGTTSTRDYGRAELHARRFVLSTDYDSATGASSGEDGVLFLNPTHSIDADRHAYQRTSFDGTQPGFNVTGEWRPFPLGSFPDLAFTTSWSGRTRITLTGAGYNDNSAASSIALSFALSGGATLVADLLRCWYSGGDAANEHSSRVYYIDLPGNTAVTLQPQWRISSGDADSAQFSPGLENSIVVEPLM